MEPSLNDSVFDEAFKIISTNRSKANLLRQSLLKNNNYDNNPNLKVIEYLGEFEYDLKTLYDILRDLQLSYHDMHNALICSNIKNKNINLYGKEDNTEFKDKKGPGLNNDFDNNENRIKGIGLQKTYEMTSSQFNKFNKNNNRVNDANEYYLNSSPRPCHLRKFNRSMSCKSYVGDWNSNPNELDDINNKSNKKVIDFKNYCNRFLENSMSDKDLSKDKSLKLNFDYDTYLTDYTLNKTNKRDANSNDINSPGKNLNLSDLNNDNNNNMNNNYYNPSNYNNNDNINNKNYNIPNRNDINTNVNKNNYFTFAEPKNNQNEENNINNSNDYNLYDNNNKNQGYNKDLINNNNSNDNKGDNRNNKYSYEDFIKDKYNNNINNKDNNSNVSPKNKLGKDISEDENYNNNVNNKDNSNEDNINDNNNEEDDDLENQKKEIIKNIISEIFQDTKKLDLLKKELGDDIGEKLLSGNINEEELFKVVEILKNLQDMKNKNMNKKNQRYFPIKKFNQPSDKILLKETLNDKRYNYKEYPRGWSSTKEYFVNNGSTYINNRKGKNFK